MPVVKSIVKSTVIKHIFFVEQSSHFDEHQGNGGKPSDTGPHERGFSGAVNWIHDKPIFDIIPPDFSFFSGLNDLEDQFSEPVGFIAEQFFLENVLYGYFPFSKLLDDEFDIFPEEVGVVSKPEFLFCFVELFFDFGRLRGGRAVFEEGCFRLPADMHELVVLELVQRVEGVLLSVEVEVAVAIVVLFVILIDLTTKLNDCWVEF